MVALGASHAKVCGAARACIVEVGAGTGEIGIGILESRPLYAGIDLSVPMLRQFEERIRRERGGETPTDGILVAADATTGWPLADGTVHAVFGSRSLHLMPTEPLLAEFRRVAAPSACLVVGRTERDPKGIRAILRRAMQEQLRERGFEPKRGSRHAKELIQLGVAIGARPIDRNTVASWRVTSTARESLDSWRTTGGLGGVTPPAAIKDGILGELEEYAANRFGGLDAPVESEESYVLEGIELAA